MSDSDASSASNDHSLMSEDEKYEGVPLLDRIEHLEELVKNMKLKALAASNNRHEAQVASAIIVDYEEVSNYLNSMNDHAVQKAHAICRELFSSLDSHDDTLPMESFWENFLDKLKALEGTSVPFRKRCLFHKEKKSEYNLLHLICGLNPPPEIVRCYLDIIPWVSESWSGRSFNHLDKAYPSGEYPLDKVIQSGGSIDVVKVLVSADLKRETLKWTYHERSVFHTLLANKEHYQPEDFSEILRYFVSMQGNIRRSALLHCGIKPPYDDILMMLLGSKLKKRLKNPQDIFEDNDFIFLLKATCYHHLSKDKKDDDVDYFGGYDDDFDKEDDDNRMGDPDTILQNIEEISISQAFTICAPCFGPNIVCVMLDKLLSEDNKFMFLKDSDGQYPIHRILMNNDYFQKSPQAMMWNGTFYNHILDIVLKHAPGCAKLINTDGLLPLHIAADLKQRRYMNDCTRLERVNIIWKAYPEAAGVIEKKTRLPPFALAGRGLDKNEKSKRLPPASHYYRKGPDISSSFFLLRQYPEIMSQYIVNSEDTDSRVDAPPSKRPRNNETGGAKNTK